MAVARLHGVRPVTLTLGFALLGIGCSSGKAPEGTGAAGAGGTVAVGGSATASLGGTSAGSGGATGTGGQMGIGGASGGSRDDDAGVAGSLKDASAGVAGNLKDASAICEHLSLSCLSFGIGQQGIALLL